MLTELSFQNFKSWRDTGAIRLAPITALFGTNSSGKTSILQMLLLLKQTAESSDRSQVLNLGDERSFVDLGTFHDIIFDNDPRASLQARVGWRLPRPLTITVVGSGTAETAMAVGMEFSTSIGLGSSTEAGLGRMTVDEMAYGFGPLQFGMKFDESEAGYLLFEIPEKFPLTRRPGAPSTLPPPVKCYGFPDQIKAHYDVVGFLSDFELEFEKQLDRLFYLGPLREYPKRQYSWGGTRPADMGPRGEGVVDALLASREVGPMLNRRGRKQATVEERVAEWLQQLGLIDSFEVRPITKGGRLFQVWVRRHPGTPEVLITDVGFGVSQILPVLTLCYYAPEGSTLLLEQPEIHLHPSVQAGLADVMIDAIKTRKIQIILESHSEHLLRRLQRRIAEEALDPEQAALYFCSAAGAESTLTPLELDAFGNIENWPKDFFGDEFGKIAAMSQAALRRKKKESE